MYAIQLDVDAGGLQELASTVSSYQRSHFEPDGKPQRGIWARLLLICGLFEKVTIFYGFEPCNQSNLTHLFTPGCSCDVRHP